MASVEVSQLYKQQSERTEKKFPDGLVIDQRQAELLHHGMGLTTEAGEFMDQLKRHLIYGKPLDETNLLEEVGDMLWYMAGIMRLCNKEFAEVMVSNLNKLQVRFPEKFDESFALIRNLGEERKQLETDLKG